MTGLLPRRMTAMTPLALAILFHDKYERLAPEFGYETRQETRKFDENSPNGKLMIAVCDELLCGTLITLTHLEYEDLIGARNKLRALEAAGVDNWEGYEALELWDEE